MYAFELKNAYLLGIGTSVTFCRTWMSMNLVLSLVPKFFRAHLTAYLLDLELLTANPIVIGGSLDGDDSVTTVSSWIAMGSQLLLHVSPCTINLQRGMTYPVLSTGGSRIRGWVFKM